MESLSKQIEFTYKRVSKIQNNKCREKFKNFMDYVVQSSANNRMKRRILRHIRGLVPETFYIKAKSISKRNNSTFLFTAPSGYAYWCNLAEEFNGPIDGTVIK